MMLKFWTILSGEFLEITFWLLHIVLLADKHGLVFGALAAFDCDLLQSADEARR